MAKTKVFITGGTGVMGFETVKEFSNRLDRFEIRLLARPSKKNRRLLKPYIRRGMTVVWGDLMNPGDVAEALGDAEYVLHIGGMVSPLADHFPEKTLQVNVGAMRNIIDAVKARVDRDDVKVVYIGSVAQTSLRHEPHHWGRTGDPVMAAVYDCYSISKIKAERLLAESGLRRWVSLRQSGILHKGLIFNGSDPISFHVPLRGVLEWATVEDSGSGPPTMSSRACCCVRWDARRPSVCSRRAGSRHAISTANGMRIPTVWRSWCRSARISRPRNTSGVCAAACPGGCR